MKTTVLISGSGGQGVVVASILLAESAVKDGFATCLPEYGPEQRGGSTKCMTVISDEEIISPMPKKFKYIVAMNEPSYKKYAGLLEEGGRMILNADFVSPEAGQEDGRKLFVPADSIATESGSLKAANIVMLGALIGMSNLMPEALLIERLSEKFADKPKALAVNLSAFQKGLELGRLFQNNQN